jgi:TonB family protein
MYLSTNLPLTLGLLPERKRDWRTFLVSYSMCLAVVLLLLLVRLIWPEHMDSWARYTVTEIMPRPSLVEEKPEAKPRIIPKSLPVAKFEAPKLIVPRDVPKPKAIEAKLEPPKILPANFETPKLQPISGTMPAKIIHTGEFGSSATPTVNAPIQSVQTGGFGDPNGLQGRDKPAKLVAAHLGSFDMADGAGTGNGTGGAKGVKGTIASAGFGNGIAQPGQGDGRRGGQGVQASGFAAQQIASKASRHSTEDAAGLTTQVEILYKPKPAYTDEARRLNIEGEVLLEVVFEANGELRVNRVVRGLGHGLDEAAVGATTKIKFKPAQRNGSAVDSTAIVHVVFQTAS